MNDIVVADRLPWIVRMLGVRFREYKAVEVARHWVQAHTIEVGSADLTEDVPLPKWWPIDKQYPGPLEHGDTVRVPPPARLDTTFGHVRVDAKPLRWPAVIIVSIGLLSAFASGVAIVWLWGRFVVACQ